MDPIMFGGVILAFVLAVALVAGATRGPQGPGHLRVVATVFLLAVAAFCVFGFLASFEVADLPAIRIIYAVFGLSSLAGAVALATYRRSSIGRSS
jgi:heme A synthase